MALTTTSPSRPVHATDSSGLADILERVLDRGVVIAGDIKIKLVDIELLTIQIRLVVCSVDKAVEMGMDWWRHEPSLMGPSAPPLPEPSVEEPALAESALEEPSGAVPAKAS